MIKVLKGRVQFINTTTRRFNRQAERIIITDLVPGLGYAVNFPVAFLAIPNCEGYVEEFLRVGFMKKVIRPKHLILKDNCEISRSNEHYILSQLSGSFSRSGGTYHGPLIWV